jgi:hypothetical protein
LYNASRDQAEYPSIYAIEDFEYTNLDVNAAYRSNTNELKLAGNKIKFIRPDDKKVIDAKHYVEGVSGTFAKIGECKKKGRTIKHEKLRNTICLIGGNLYSFEDAIVFMNENGIDLRNYYNAGMDKLQLSKHKDGEISCEIINVHANSHWYIVTKIDRDGKKSYIYWGKHEYYRYVNPYRGTWANKKVDNTTASN